jgi:hypothetical protein
MTDSFKVLYNPLPEKISGLPDTVKHNTPGEDSSSSSALKSFLTQHLAGSEKNEIESEFKKTFPLHKQKVKKITKPQPR